MLLVVQNLVITNHIFFRLVAKQIWALFQEIYNEFSLFWGKNPVKTGFFRVFPILSDAVRGQNHRKSLLPRRGFRIGAGVKSGVAQEGRAQVGRALFMIIQDVHELAVDRASRQICLAHLIGLGRGHAGLRVFGHLLQE